MLALLQGQIQNTSAAGVAHLFAGLFLILAIYTSALLFTYWISKDE
jgi:hypothetical protein